MELLTIGGQELLKKMERATGIEPATSSLGKQLSRSLFSIRTKWLGKTNVHARIPVHALPDLLIAGGRFGDGFYHTVLFSIAEYSAHAQQDVQSQLVKPLILKSLRSE